MVNTCTVIQRAERRILRALAEMKGRDLYIIGCMPKVQMGKIREVCSPRVIDREELRSHAPGLGVRRRVRSVRCR